MFYEKFEVEPVGDTTDPLNIYFKSSPTFLVGALTNFEFLSEKPVIIPLDLNEWVRFDKPGTYRITAISKRVDDTTVGSYKHGTSVAIKSNTIELQILAPDPAWQQSELEKIRAELAHPPAYSGPFMPESRYLAFRELRFLGSPDATRELARHISDDERGVSSLCLFGLIGSSNRMAVLEELKKLLADPDFPVSANFLMAMSILPLDPNGSPEDLLKQRSANMKAAQNELVNALPKKKGKALDESLNTAMQNMDSTVVTELKSKFIVQLIESFNQLSIEDQLRWLERDWPKVKDPAWLPTLRAIASQFTEFVPPRLSTEERQSLKLTSIALTRWYDLDPEGARGAVIAEILRPKPRYSANTLGLLPDVTLSAEQQEIIASHFLSAPDFETEGYLASLLNRYADATVLPLVLDRIRRKVQNQSWECIPEYYSLAYVEKVDPEAAQLLRDQLKDSPCLKMKPSNFPSNFL